MKIAIVILNWNGKALLEQFLPSVMQYSSEHADIYVADNGSTDNSLDFLNSNYPEIKIINNDRNYGFAQGYNMALKQVVADIYCLLNNDVEVEANWLSPIIAMFNSQPETAIIQPKILNYHQKDQFDYAGAAGGFIDKYGFPYCRGRVFETIEKDHGQYDDSMPIFWASGACLFIRQQHYWDLNGMDDQFFAHMEEIDLCWRSYNSGATILYNGNCVVYHLGGGTLHKSNPRKTYLNFRNSLFMLTKNLPGRSLFSTMFTRLFLDGIAAIWFLLQLKPQHTFAVLKSHFSFYMNLKRLLSQRNTIQPRENYYMIKSVVRAYFIDKKRTYKRL